MTALSVNDGSARTYLVPLRSVGLIDELDKPTDLANRWRDDTAYTQVAKEILDTVYPKELRDLFPTISNDATIESIKGWMMNHLKVGESAAGSMAAFYLMLLSGKVPIPGESGSTVKKSAASPRPAPRVKAPPVAAAGIPSTMTKGAQVNESRIPSIHVDIQVHIPKDSTPEQLDQIFASMAKHFNLGSNA